MEMHPDFAGFYIETLSKEIDSLTRARLLLTAQGQYSEKIIADLTERLQKLETAAAKKTKKEVDTSGDTF